jgi:prevent-host-death family protein
VLRTPGSALAVNPCRVTRTEFSGGTAEYSAGTLIDILDHQTRSGHNLVMRLAKISELKTHLSKYLAEVRRGKTVVICDRDTCIARLVPYREELDNFVVEERVRPRAVLSKVRGVALRRPVDPLQLLREARDQR